MSRIRLHNSNILERCRPPVTARFAHALPGWPVRTDRRRSATTKGVVIGVLPGEGVGPEVVAATVEVLRVVASCTEISLDMRYGGAIGKVAEKLSGQSLTPPVVRFCESVFADRGAILCGPGGGRFVYELRSRFNLFCKFTPVEPFPELLDAGTVNSSAREGSNLVVVRENVGGAYFGQWRRHQTSDGQRQAEHTFGYNSHEIRRIMSVAIRLAQARSRLLSLVVKRDAIPSISELWVEHFLELTAGENLETRVLEVDNACYQLIASARDFDVVVAPNMLGDILSDVAALLLGSRGLSFSGNFGAPGVAVYQTGHGAAYDLAGQNVANPIGQMLSAAMMLRESFGFVEAAAAIEAAIVRTVAAGIRTVDVAVPGSTVVGTREFGQCVADAVESAIASVEIAS